MFDPDPDARYVVDFGSDTAAAERFVATLTGLGHLATWTDSRVTISDGALSALFLSVPTDTDGDIVAHRDGRTAGVRIGGYAYTLWPESAGPKLATRWAL